VNDDVPEPGRNQNDKTGPPPCGGGPHFCPLKIAEDARKYAAEQGIAAQDALKKGMEEKSREFMEKGGELDAKT